LSFAVYKFQADVNVPLFKDGGWDLSLELQVVLIVLLSEHFGNKRMDGRRMLMALFLWNMQIRSF
jgi:hypothetical protein